MKTIDNKIYAYLLNLYEKNAYSVMVLTPIQ